MATLFRNDALRLSSGSGSDGRRGVPHKVVVHLQCEAALQTKNITQFKYSRKALVLNPLTPNDHYNGRTAPLTSKRCILYIYSTNIVAEYFKHGIYSQFFPLQNAVCFIILTYLVPVLFTFYIQGVLKLKKK